MGNVYHKDLTGADLHDPKAHKASHEDSGSDEISVQGLSGVLVDLQNPNLAQGTDAGKPAAGTAGKLYYASDTKILYRDNGASWDEIVRGETASRLAQLSEKSHTSLTDKGTNTHADIDTHVSATSSVHGFDASGNAPAQAHDNAKHSATYITASGVTYENLSANSDIGTGATQVAQGDHTHADNFGYVIKVQALTSSPTDAQTVYFGMLPKAPTTTANISKVYIRKAGTIKIAEIYCYSGTAGTNENWSLYIRKNNTTDYLIATLGVATSERVFSNTGLSIAVAAGDYIEIKGIQPTWATNPLTTIYGGYIYIE